MALPKVSLKTGVHMIGRNLEDEVHVIIHAARQTAPDFKDKTLWVTSATDGKHMDESKHYTGEAFDLRTFTVVGGAAEVARWATRLRDRLGPDYDVVVEQTHLHAEYDPKRIHTNV